MKKSLITIRSLLFCLVLVLSFFISTSISYANEERIFDDAQLFTEKDKQKLTTQIKKLQDKMNMDIVIVTTNNAEGKTAMDYADDYYDMHNFGTGSEKSGILLLVDMDNREVFVSTAGDMISVLNDNQIEGILDKVVEELPKKNYLGAAKAFLKKTDYYYQQKLAQDEAAANKNQTVQPRGFTFSKLFASILSSALISGFFYKRVKKKYRLPKVPKLESTTNGALILSIDQDDLYDQKTTSRIVPKKVVTKSNQSEKPKTTTRTSSSGKKHGGNGRSF